MSYLSVYRYLARSKKKGNAEKRTRRNYELSKAYSHSRRACSQHHREPAAAHSNGLPPALSAHVIRSEIYAIFSAMLTAVVHVLYKLQATFRFIGISINSEYLERAYTSNAVVFGYLHELHSGTPHALAVLNRLGVPTAEVHVLHKRRSTWILAYGNRSQHI